MEGAPHGTDAVTASNGGEYRKQDGGLTAPLPSAPGMPLLPAVNAADLDSYVTALGGRRVIRKVRCRLEKRAFWGREGVVLSVADG